METPLNAKDSPNHFELAQEIQHRYFELDGLPGQLFCHVIAYISYPSDEPNSPDMINFLSENIFNGIDKNVPIQSALEVLQLTGEYCKFKLEQAQLLLQFYGARTTEDPSCEVVTHIVIEESNLHDLGYIRKLFKGFVKRLITIMK